MNQDNQTDCDSPTSSMSPRKTLAERKAHLQRLKENLAKKTAALNKEARS